MSRDPNNAAAGALLAVLLLCAAIVYVAWGSIVRLDADATENGIALWVYDDDAERGGSIDARIRIDAGERVRIDGIEVRGGGLRQRFGGGGQTWGTTLEGRRVPASASASVDFAIKLPDIDAETVRLVIRVDATAAVSYSMTTFSNVDHAVTFTHDVRLHGSATVRRAIRVACALGAGVLVVGLLVLARRRCIRRNHRPHGAWALLLVPHAVVGWLCTRQLAIALGVHGLWFIPVGMIAWWALLALPGRLTGPLGLRRYRIAPAVVPTAAEGGAYRTAAVPERVVPALDVEGAWMAAGLVVQRRRGWIEVGPMHAEPARVRIPRGDSFGGPFDIHAADRATVERMLVAVAPLLGELRGHADGEPELRIGAR
jgi:hypothetical protein